MADTIRVLGTTGDDYTTTAAMVADIPANIVTHGGDNWVVEVRAGFLFDGFTIPQVTTDATHQLIIRAVSGDEVDGSGVGAGFEGSTGGSSGFVETQTNQTNTTHLQMVGLKINSTSGNSAALSLDDSSNKLFKDVFITNASGVGFRMQNAAVCQDTFENVIIAGCSGAGTDFGNVSGSANLTLNIVTIANNGGVGLDDRGFGTSGFIDAKNILSYGNTGDDFGTRLNFEGAAVDYLASSDTTASAEAFSVAFDSRTTADFVDYAGGDYSLASGSTLRGAGEGGADIGATLPAATGGGSSTGTLSVTLDDVTAVGDGQIAVNGALSVTLDDATVDGSTSASHTGTLSVTLDDVTAVGDGQVVVNGALTTTLDDVTAVGDGQVVVNGALTTTLDDATLLSLPTITGQAGITLNPTILVGQGVGEIVERDETGNSEIPSQDGYLDDDEIVLCAMAFLEALH